MAKNLIIIFGFVFVIIGILGFVSNPVIGANGFFFTNHAHDIVHLIVGLLFLIVGFSAAASAAGTLIVFGVLFALLAILGFIVPSPILGLATNGALNWIDIIFAIIFIIGGFSSKPR